MSNRGDCPDDAKGSVFLEGDTVLAREDIGFQKLDAWDAISDEFKLFDFMREPAYFGFFHFITAQLISPLEADFANAGECFSAVFKAPSFEGALCCNGGCNCRFNITEDAIRACFYSRCG